MFLAPFAAEVKIGAWISPFVSVFWGLQAAGPAIACFALLGKHGARDRRLSWAFFVFAAFFLFDVTLAVWASMEPMKPASAGYLVSLVAGILETLPLVAFFLLGGVAFRSQIGRRRKMLGWGFAALGLYFLVVLAESTYYSHSPGIDLEFLRSAVNVAAEFLSLLASLLVARHYWRIARDGGNVRESWLARRDLLLLVIASAYMLGFVASLRVWHFLFWYSALGEWHLMPAAVFAAIGFFVAWRRRGGIRDLKQWRQGHAEHPDTRSAD